ncbi:MAG: rhombosortase [Pseudomonadota bacterium]
MSTRLASKASPWARRKGALAPLALTGILSALCAWQWLAGDDAVVGWLWDRAALDGGQWWRLISAHLVHLNVMHGVMNIAATVLIFALVGTATNTIGWILAWLMISLAVGLALLQFDQQLSYYAGASGVLHGVVAFGALRLLRSRRYESAVLLAGLALKLCWEQWTGATAGTEALIGIPVVVNAHLYGALAGCAVFALFAAAARVHTNR